MRLCCRPPAAPRSHDSKCAAVIFHAGTTSMAQSVHITLEPARSMLPARQEGTRQAGHTRFALSHRLRRQAARNQKSEDNRKQADLIAARPTWTHVTGSSYTANSHRRRMRPTQEHQNDAIPCSSKTNMVSCNPVWRMKSLRRKLCNHHLRPTYREEPKAAYLFA
jgi:hypothetical protein